MKPFDMSAPPVTTPWPLMPLIWGASFIMTKSNHLKLKKIGMSGVKPPFLVISTHQGFSDYYIAPLILRPFRPNYVSDMEGFAAFGKRLYRAIGCIGKRRYVPDVTVMQNIGKCFEMGNPVVIYPESRHSNVGTTSRIPDNLGRLAKHFAKRYGTPLVILSAHGSYLANPFWDEEHTRKGKMEATLELLHTTDELLGLDASVIQKEIEEKLQYDEYAWQAENKIRFVGKDKKNPADGIHLPLYKCRNCGRKYTMISRGNRLGCTSCRKIWKLTPSGKLYDSDKKEYSIVDWYNWERENAEKELGFLQATAKGAYKTFNVNIEALPNEYGFVKLGSGKLTLDGECFKLRFTPKKKYNYTPKDWIFNDKKNDEVTLIFPHKIRESLQTEYNYRGRGPAVVLSHQDCTYYLYSEDKDFNPTELQFIAEALYEKNGKQN